MFPERFQILDFEQKIRFNPPLMSKMEMEREMSYMNNVPNIYTCRYGERNYS